MKLKYVLIVLAIFLTKDSFALDVTASVTSLSCNTTNVKFTFDCAFNGTVLIPNPQAGVTYPELTGPVFIETVTSGMISFDIQSSASASSIITVSFIVLSSDLNCALSNDSASVDIMNGCGTIPNDDCAGATPLTISQNSCMYQAYPTDLGNVANSIPSCGIPLYHDLWYSFIANNDTIILEFNSLPGNVGFFGLYTDCPNNGGIELDCSIIVPATGTTNLEFTGLMIGDQYLVQMLYIFTSPSADQELCLHSTTPIVPCETNIMVSDIGPNFPSMSYQASQVISTNGPTQLTATGIIFDGGGGVELNPDFDTAGFTFEAVVIGCTP